MAKIRDIRDIPTVAELRQLVQCDPYTGDFVWLERPLHLCRTGNTSREANCRAWNKRFAGKPAFTTKSVHGYYQGAIFHRIYRAHLVAYALYHGEWLEYPYEIDHWDKDKLNNRISNLRPVTKSENNCNMRLKSTNTSGYNGVRWNVRDQVYVARGQAKGYPHLYAGFKTEAEAVACRKAWEEGKPFTAWHGT